MRIKGFIFKLVIIAAASSAQATTTIKEDTKGAVLAKAAAEANGVPAAHTFESLNRDQVYVNIKTSGGLLIHIRADQVLKYVFYLKPGSLPTRFLPEDLAVIKAKLDELHVFAGLAPAAKKVCAPYLKSLEHLYETESKQYKLGATASAQEYDTEQEKAAYDKKCDLMRLDLIANRDDIKRSEEIVKEMEPLAARSQQISGVLAQWSEERGRALQLAEEGRKIWTEALETRPEYFAHVSRVQDIPDIPADLKKKTVDLSQRLDQFRASATYPQTLTYCRAEIPAYFLLNQLPKLLEKIKARQFEEAITLAQKTTTQVEGSQISGRYKPIYAAFKNYWDLAQDFESRFLSRLAEIKQTESDYTDSELLGEYQKLYEMIPDSKVAARMAQLKAKIDAK